MKRVGPSALALVEPVECPTFMGVLWVQKVGDANEESRFLLNGARAVETGARWFTLVGMCGVQVLRGRLLPFLLSNGKPHLG